MCPTLVAAYEMLVPEAYFAFGWLCGTVEGFFLVMYTVLFGCVPDEVLQSKSKQLKPLNVRADSSGATLAASATENWATPRSQASVASSFVSAVEAPLSFTRQPFTDDTPVKLTPGSADALITLAAKDIAAANSAPDTNASFNQASGDDIAANVDQPLEALEDLWFGGGSARRQESATAHQTGYRPARPARTSSWFGRRSARAEHSPARQLTDSSSRHERR